LKFAIRLQKKQIKFITRTRSHRNVNLRRRWVVAIICLAVSRLKASWDEAELKEVEDVNRV